MVAILNAALESQAKANAAANAAKATVAASEAMVAAVIRKAGILQLKSKAGFQQKDAVSTIASATESATASATESTHANFVDAACSICFDEKVDCALNCGHLFCFDCARHLNHCSTCRAPIRVRNRIYL